MVARYDAAASASHFFKDLPVTFPAERLVRSFN
jgi:hypothetical protein